MRVKPKALAPLGAVLAVAAVAAGLYGARGDGFAPRKPNGLAVTSVSSIPDLPGAPRLPAASSPQVAAVESTFARASVLLQTMVVPPNAAVDHQATAADLWAMQRNAMTALGRYFTPAAAAQQASQVAHAASALADPNFRSLGGGVSAITYDAVHIDGDSATVSAHVTAWARMAQLHAGKAAVVQPSGVLIVTCRLQRASAESRWLITNYDWSYAPGSAP